MAARVLLANGETAAATASAAETWATTTAARVSRPPAPNARLEMARRAASIVAPDFPWHGPNARSVTSRALTAARITLPPGTRECLATEGNRASTGDSKGMDRLVRWGSNRRTTTCRRRSVVLNLTEAAGRISQGGSSSSPTRARVRALDRALISAPCRATADGRAWPTRLRRRTIAGDPASARVALVSRVPPTGTQGPTADRNNPA